MKDGWIWPIGIGAVLLLSGSGGILLAGRKFTYNELNTLAFNAGFGGASGIAAAIALAESGGDPNALGDLNIGSGTGSFGLWQINADSHPEFGPNFSQLYNPQTNASAAFSVYQKAGNSFIPWSTYNNGSYFNYLPV